MTASSAARPRSLEDASVQLPLRLYGPLPSLVTNAVLALLGVVLAVVSWLPSSEASLALKLLPIGVVFSSGLRFAELMVNRVTPRVVVSRRALGIRDGMFSARRWVRREHVASLRRTAKYVEFTIIESGGEGEVRFDSTDLTAEDRRRLAWVLRTPDISGVFA